MRCLLPEPSATCSAFAYPRVTALKLENDDRIARPSRGRVFPATPAEIARWIRDMGFAPPVGRPRLDIILRNEDALDELGAQVAEFRPREFLVVFSTRLDVDLACSKAILERACRELAEVDMRSGPSVKAPAMWKKKGENVITYRAYLGPPNHLVITRRTRRARLAKYRGDAKFSNAFKPKGVKTDETVLHSVEIT